jgi:hypothetical protein
MLADRDAHRAQRGELGGPEPSPYLRQPNPGQLVDEHLLGLHVNDVGNASAAAVIAAERVTPCGSSASSW